MTTPDFTQLDLTRSADRAVAQAWCESRSGTQGAADDLRRAGFGPTNLAELLGALEDGRVSLLQIYLIVHTHGHDPQLLHDLVEAAIYRALPDVDLHAALTELGHAPTTDGPL